MASCHQGKEIRLQRPTERPWPSAHSLRGRSMLQQMLDVHSYLYRGSRMGPVPRSLQAVLGMNCAGPLCEDAIAVVQSAAAAFASAPIPPQAPTTFDPQLPGVEVLAVQGFVLGLTAAVAGYWWLVIVPSERAALGRSKRLGPLNTYLQHLESPGAARERWLERWFYTDWLRKRQERRHQREQRASATASSATSSAAAAAAADSPADDDAGTAEDSSRSSSTAADPYNDDAAPGGNLLRPAASTHTPRFLSLDNPIVATGVLLLLAAAVAGLQQR